jgi:hypothetical protein
MGASEGSATPTPPAEAGGGIQGTARVKAKAAKMTRGADRKEKLRVLRVNIL